MGGQLPVQLLQDREVSQLLSTQDPLAAEQCRLKAQAYQEFLRLLEPKPVPRDPNA